MINTMSIKTDFTFYISIYFLCSFKSIFLYGIFLILIVVYCFTIQIRFEGKVYISYNLIIYGPYGPTEFAHFLQQIGPDLPIITSTGMREQIVLPMNGILLVNLKQFLVQRILKKLTFQRYQKTSLFMKHKMTFSIIRNMQQKLLKITVQFIYFILF